MIEDSVLFEAFNYPFLEACEKLRIGSTALKRLCREKGIKRWPYRRLAHQRQLNEYMQLEKANPEKNEVNKPSGINQTSSSAQAGPSTSCTSCTVTTEDFHSLLSNPHSTTVLTTILQQASASEMPCQMEAAKRLLEALTCSVNNPGRVALPGVLEQQVVTSGSNLTVPAATPSIPAAKPKVPAATSSKPAACCTRAKMEEAELRNLSLAMYNKMCIPQGYLKTAFDILKYVRGCDSCSSELEVFTTIVGFLLQMSSKDQTS